MTDFTTLSPAKGFLDATALKYVQPHIFFRWLLYMLCALSMYFTQSNRCLDETYKSPLLPDHLPSRSSSQSTVRIGLPNTYIISYLKYSFDTRRYPERWMEPNMLDTLISPGTLQALRLSSSMHLCRRLKSHLLEEKSGPSSASGIRTCRTSFA